MLDDGTALGSTRNGHSSAPPELEQPFVSQDVQGSVDRVGVHAEYRSEISSWWQAFAGLRLTVGNGAADLGGDLFVKRQGIGGVDLPFRHNAIYSSTTAGGGRWPKSGARRPTMWWGRLRP